MNSRTFFVGERITQADLTLYSALQMLFEHLLDEAARRPYPHLVRWFTTVANQPEVKKVVGEMKLCVTPAVFDPKNAPQESKQRGPKKEKQPKQQPKKEEPKKKEKPRGDDAMEEEEPAPKPSKNPLAALPAGKLNYDEFKKVYSNENIRTVAIPFFWENFDPAFDSIWVCEYNYPEELRLTFMSANLIAGMFQRLERWVFRFLNTDYKRSLYLLFFPCFRMQKFSFAVVNVFGENSNSTIGGVWVWRGTDLVFGLSPDLQVDYESYTWTKLDHNDPKAKKLIEDYFARDCDIDGKKIADGIVFK